MNKWMIHLACGMALCASAAVALAQSADAAKPGVATAAPGQPAQRAPDVESVDILKQDQAQRSKDQPGNLAPTYRIVKEGQPNYSSLPQREGAVLIQPKAQFPGQARATTAGEAWRQYRNGPLTTIGGWLLIAALAAIAAMYLIRGPIKLEQGRSGRLIERFTSVERIAHWTMAISFVVLAVSGLAMLFGKHVLLPIFGHVLFGWLAFVLKNLHNFVGPVFAVSIIVAFVIFVKDNFPAAADLKWFVSLGGLFSGKHASAGRFNGGEKAWFWIGVVFIGLTVSASGFVLDMLVPGLDYTRSNMQIANVIHIIGSVLITGMALGHIYIGTIGTEAAYESMRTGYVDDVWAEQHHDLWYDDIKSGKVPRVRSREGEAKIGAPARAH